MLLYTKKNKQNVENIVPRNEYTGIIFMHSAFEFIRVSQLNLE